MKKTRAKEISRSPFFRKWKLLSIIVIFSTVCITMFYAQVTDSYANQAQTVPSPNCVSVGNQPCSHTVSPSPGSINSVSPGSTSPGSPSNTETISGTPSNNTTSPSPSTTPCSTSQASVSSQNSGTVHTFAKGGKKHYSGRQGFLQQFFLFLWQLLQLIFKQLGIQLPNITPCSESGSNPSPSATPSGTGGGSGNGNSGGTSGNPSSAPSKTANPSGSATAPSAVPSSGGSSSNPQPNGVSGNWKLIFDDEFNNTALNTTVWAPGWFGSGVTAPISSAGTDCYDPAEVQFPGDGYMHLHYEAKQETCGGATKQYASGFVSSNPQDGVSGHTGFQYAYGYMEVRAYLPPSGSQIADWPAIWTDGQNWPTDGEDDIMEGLDGQPCYHFHSPAGGPGDCATGNFSGWHTFASDWKAGSVTYYYDGKQVGQITTGITSAPQYIIMSNDQGPDNGAITVPTDMQVDYVRVWQAQ